MTSNDAIWALYAKSVKRLKKAKTSASARTAKLPSRLREGMGAGGEFAALRAIEYSLHQPSGPPSIPPARGREALSALTLDRRVEKNLRQGEIALEARIDLHGMTQAEAHTALAHFMAAQVKAGRRNLLIITGKGRGNAGVLKTNLPHWLQSLPEASQILALRPAAPNHGGEGAFYVVLKKGQHRRIKHTV